MSDRQKPNLKIKKGDTVKVIAGKDKGAEGKVIKVIREESRVIVEGVNRIKKHTKAIQGGPAGGIITTEAPIHVSNVMLLEGGTPTRLSSQRVEVTKRRPDGSEYQSTRSVRVSRKTGKEL
ncbi:50S ribosomal protein L24 [Nocardioides montaniterrae]